MILKRAVTHASQVTSEAGIDINNLPEAARNTAACLCCHASSSLKRIN